MVKPPKRKINDKNGAEKIPKEIKNDRKAKPTENKDVGLFFEKIRQNFCARPLDFKFNKERVKLLNGCNTIPEGKSNILYWMHRDQRVQGIFKL